MVVKCTLLWLVLWNVGTYAVGSEYVEITRGNFTMSCRLTSRCVAAALESGCLSVAGAGTHTSNITSLSRRCTVWSVLDSANQHNHLLTRCAYLCHFTWTRRGILGLRLFDYKHDMWKSFDVVMSFVDKVFLSLVNACGLIFVCLGYKYGGGNVPPV